MNNNQTHLAEAIRAEYEEKKRTKLDELMELDRKVKLPAEIFAFVFGTIGALVLGFGMCLAMKVIGDMMALGIVVGVVGIAMVSVNYFIYKMIINRGKKEYGERILALTEEIIGEEK